MAWVVSAIGLQQTSELPHLSTTYVQPSLNAKPAPTSSVSFAPKIELKSPSSFGASPRIGAFGLATLLLLSWPALEGNVGNMLAAFGRGS
jgi:hypothetical protein